MVEGFGAGAGSVPHTNESGSRRPRNIRIRIRNTGQTIPLTALLMQVWRHEAGWAGGAVRGCGEALWVSCGGVLQQRRHQPRPGLEEVHGHRHSEYRYSYNHTLLNFRIIVVHFVWSKVEETDLVSEIFTLHILCSTTGKPTRSFATERVSLDSV